DDNAESSGGKVGEREPHFHACIQAVFVATGEITSPCHPTLSIDRALQCRRGRKGMQLLLLLLLVMVIFKLLTLLLLLLDTLMAGELGRRVPASEVRRNGNRVKPFGGEAGWNRL